jgi:hypothetical protein
MFTPGYCLRMLLAASSATPGAAPSKKMPGRGCQQCFRQGDARNPPAKWLSQDTPRQNYPDAVRRYQIRRRYQTVKGAVTAGCHDIFGVDCNDVAGRQTRISPALLHPTDYTVGRFPQSNIGDPDA